MLQIPALAVSHRDHSSEPLKMGLSGCQMEFCHVTEFVSDRGRSDRAIRPDF
jgi:hypothetical protein